MQKEVPEGYLFDGGAAQLPLKLAAQLPRGDVRLNQPVMEINQGKNASGGATVTVRTPDAAFTCRAVIVAMPPHCMGRIRYTPPMPSVRDMLTHSPPMGNVIKVLALYQTPWWRGKDMSGTGYGDLRTLEFVADSTNPAPG